MLVTFGPLSCAPSWHMATNYTHFQREAHSTSFRFVASSFTQQAAVHTLPLLCSPALSSGLRPVMLFANAVLFLPFPGEIKEGATKNHARPCSFRSSSFAQIKRCFTSLIVRTALRFVPPLRALCSHPTSCSRTHPV